MAKKRLNKKVALIGSVIFIFLAFGAMLAFLHLSRNPEKFEKDGDDAFIAKDYEMAARNYHRARVRFKTDSRRVEILFKLVDVYIEIGEWNNVIGCWTKIVQLDSKNLEARLGRLGYFHIIAANGSPKIWKEIESQASAFIESVDSGVLEGKVADWQPSEVQNEDVKVQFVGSYLYLLKGKAAAELAKRGAVTEPERLLTQGADDLRNVLEIEPNNISAYQYLAEIIIAKGELFAVRGNREEINNAFEEAKELLEKAVNIVPENIKAHINLLSINLALAQQNGTIRNENEVQSLESEYVELTEKFSSDGEAFLQLAIFYRLLGHKYIDKAAEAIGRAIELDNTSIVYARSAADIYSRKFSIQKKDVDLFKAVEIAQKALTLPGAEDTTGPRQQINKMNRISLYTLLARSYIEQILEFSEAKTKVEFLEDLSEAKIAVHEIEQLYGSGENPKVAKWRGMLELAKEKLGKGDKNLAIRQIYAAYEQLKASGRPDAQISYTLAKVFENTSEIGAVLEFIAGALNAGITQTRPEALLDFAEALLRVNVQAGALSNIDMFEKYFWVNERSQSLRIRAYIVAKQFDKAEEILATEHEKDNSSKIKSHLTLLQAQIGQLRSEMQMKEISDEGKKNNQRT